MSSAAPSEAVPELGPAHFHALVEAASDGIISADRAGNVVSWNAKAKALFGYAADSSPAGRLSDLIPGWVDPGEGDATGAPMERVGRRKDGTEFPAEVSLSSMTTGDGRFTVAAVRDITRRRKEDQALRGSEELYRRIIETTHQGVCIADPEYRYLFVNDRLCEMLGYGPGELIGMTVFDLVAPAGVVAQRARMERRRQGRPESGELGLRRKDGTEVWVLFESHSIFEDGRYQGVLSMMMDISERKAIEARLERSEAQLSQAQEVARIGSWDWDLATNVLTRSEQYRRMLGMDREDPGAEGMPVYEKIHPEDRERVLREQAQSLRDRLPWICDYRLLLPDGVRLVHTRGDVVVDAAGCPVRLVGTVQDVTEKKEAEARIILADRLVSVGTLALGVAHEINNPLAYVIANLDMASEEIRRLAADTPSATFHDLEEMAQDARDGAERVRKIVRGLKSFSRADEDRPTVLDLRRVIEVAINMVFNEVRHRARLVKDYGEVPPVLADEGRLGQVFINLLVNAAQSFPDGGTERNEIRVVTRTLPDGRALAEVHDTGPGIPADVIGRVFDPFFTTKAVGVGTGLGLSICHGIVTGLGGELTVQSDPRSGTVFRVVLAAAAPETPAERTRAVSMRPDPGSHASVLIVDDDAIVAKTLSRVLQGHDIVVTTNGKQALELLMTGRRFDVILCDLMMPVMNGMELHAQLGEKLPHLVDRIIFLTGGAFTPAARTFLDEVTNECLEKPFDARNLRALVHRAARLRAASS